MTLVKRIKWHGNEMQSILNPREQK